MAHGLKFPVCIVHLAMIAFMIVFFALIFRCSPSPQNLSVTAKQFHANTSSFIIKWKPGIGSVANHHTAHYHVEMVVFNETVESVSTTNTTASFSDAPYNENITILLTANKYYGASPPVRLAFTIGKKIKCMHTNMPNLDYH